MLSLHLKYARMCLFVAIFTNNRIPCRGCRIGAKVNKSIKNILKLVKKIFGNLVKTVLPIMLGVLILYMIYADFDFSRLWNDLSGMNLFWFAASTFFGIMSHVLRGWRWKLTLAPLGYRPLGRVCVYSVFIAYAANLVVPRIGEVSRCVVLEQNDKVPFAQSLGTLVTERLIDTCMVLAITISAVVLQWPVFCAYLEQAGFMVSGGGVLASMGGWLVIFLSLAAVLVLIFFIVRKMNFWKKIRSFIVQFAEGLLSLKRMSNGWLFVAETFGIWFCYFMQFYLCFYCFRFSSGLPLLAGLLLFVAGSIAVVVPTPNGAGPWHFAIISIMLLYGVDSTDAEAFALIVHSTQTLLVAVLGIYALVMLQFDKRLNNKHKNL